MTPEDQKEFLDLIVKQVGERSGAHRALGQLIEHLKQKDPQPTWERDYAIIRVLEKVQDHLGDPSSDKANDQ